MVSVQSAVSGQLAGKPLGTPLRPHVHDTYDYDGALLDDLRTHGHLSEHSIDRVHRVRDQGGERLSLAEVICTLGLVAEKDLAVAAARVLGVPIVTEEDYPRSPLFFGELPARFLRQFRVVPLTMGDGGVELAVADPGNTYAAHAIGLRLGRNVRVRPGIPADIEAAIDRLYGSRPELIDQGDDPLAIGALDHFVDLDIERLRDQASEAPIIRMVNQIIGEAVERRASDIHLEPMESRCRIRYRIDGVLLETGEIPLQQRLAVVSRIKILARLNIAERRLPQDGRFKLSARGRAVDIRVATVPTLFGESIVLRVLDPDGIVLNFNALGIDGSALARLRSILDKPNGITLVTGPTGSGKTTTLYAALDDMRRGKVKVLTVEDPVEFQIEGIEQVQVKPQIGLSFPDALRAFLRHDPDIIMVGEIRDKETAQVAIQAALTGHLVLSTLHTNSAAATIVRLLDMGIENYLLASTINGIVAQRLVRRLCARCREPYTPSSAFLFEAGIAAAINGEPAVFFQPVGCRECRGTGYAGRTAIIETLVMDERIRDLVLADSSEGRIGEAAIESGMTSLHADGIVKARAGITSIQEVMLATAGH